MCIYFICDVSSLVVGWYKSETTSNNTFYPPVKKTLFKHACSVTLSISQLRDASIVNSVYAWLLFGGKCVPFSKYWDLEFLAPCAMVELSEMELQFLSNRT